MNHPIYKIESFEKVGCYELRITFNDGFSRTIDFKPILAGEILGPLRDPDCFSQVRIDPEIHTLVWPSGADFDPETLRNWPEYEAEFKAAAKHWKKVSVSQ